MTEPHKQILRQNKAELIRDISLTGQFYTYLESLDVFNLVTITNIKSAGNEYKQKELLIEELSKRDKKAFDNFCKALEKDEQSHIVKKYLKRTAVQPVEGTSMASQASSSTVLSQKIQYEHMRLVSKSGSAQDKWKQLTRALGLENKEPDLRRIVNHESHENAVYKALQDWVSANGKDATVGKLVEILKEEKLKDLAEKLLTLPRSPTT